MERGSGKKEGEEDKEEEEEGVIRHMKQWKMPIWKVMMWKDNSAQIACNLHYMVRFTFLSYLMKIQKVNFPHVKA